jgi:endonuclease YncB( thermonuclease family)
MLRVLAVLAQMIVISLPLHAAEISGSLRVIDGDTVDVAGTRVRIHGIDAPERGQPCTTQTGADWGCGDWVTRQVSDRFQGAFARCAPVDRDRYGRVVARCSVKGADIGRLLVTDGLAFAYEKYSTEYVPQETVAATARRGLHGFSMQSPARYRLMRIKGRTAPDPNCVIKGNINARGTRIYHVPGQAYYARTGVRVDQGERWFCSTAQARASGWRAAKR